MEEQKTSYDLITNRGTVFFAKDRDAAEHHYTNLVQDMKLGYNEYVKMVDRTTGKVVKEAYSDKYIMKSKTSSVYGTTAKEVRNG